MAYQFQSTVIRLPKFAKKNWNYLGFALQVAFTLLENDFNAIFQFGADQQTGKYNIKIDLIISVFHEIANTF